MHRPISWFGAFYLPLLLAFSALSAISPHAQSISAQTIEIDAAAPARPARISGKKCLAPAAPS